MRKPIITLTDLWDALDGFFSGNPHMSNDPREVEADRVDSIHLSRMAKLIPGGMKLWADFCAWNMSQWDKSAKYPKPSRPVEICSAM